MTRIPPRWLRPTATVGVLALVVGALTGCGSRLSDEQVLAQNLAVEAQQPMAAELSPGDSAPPAPAPSDVGLQTGTIGRPAVPGSGTATSRPTESARTGSGAATAPVAGARNGSAALSPVNVGQLGINSGLVGTILGSARTGAQIWAKYINRHGGLNGHPVNLISVDTGGDPATALSAMQGMVKNDQVVAFLMYVDVLSTPTIASYVKKVGVPVIGGTAVEAEWYSNPYFFPQGASARVDTDGAIKAGIDQGHRTVGIVYCSEFAIICSNIERHSVADTPALGGEVALSQQVSLAQPDYTSQCLAAKGAGVDNLVLLLDPNAVGRFTESCERQGYRPFYAITGIVMNDALLKYPTTAGIVSMSSNFPYTVDSPETATYRQATLAVTGRAPASSFEAAAWVAGLILQKAALQGPLSPTDPSAAQIVAGLHTIRNDSFGGLTAPLTFRAGSGTVSPACFFPFHVASNGFSAPDGLKRSCIDAAFTRGPQ